MIILDHNIPEDQAQRLRRRRVRFRQIGFEVGRPEWDDQQEILRFLHATKQITFFTRDLVFPRVMASRQLLPNGIDCARLGNSPLCFYVVASPSFQHQSQADWESHKGFNKEHNLLGDRAAATEYRPLVNALL